MLHELEGGCRCGAVRIEARFKDAPLTRQPRRCDCAFCVKHGAAWVSDVEGDVTFRVARAGDLSRYRQSPDGQAEFLFCARCGVLCGVSYVDPGGRLYAAVNALVFTGSPFGDAITVSPRQLGADEKRSRWTSLWFKRVRSLVGHS